MNASRDRSSAAGGAGLPVIRLARERLVRRPRLDKMLSRAVQGAVTLVVAPAGSGKTLLVASWAAATALPGPVVWVSAEHGEADATTFWLAVTNGLRASGVASGSSVLAGLAPAPRIGDEFVDRFAEGLAQLRRPVVLVVDDVHRMGRAGPFQALAGLLAVAPSQLHTVLVTRSELDLGLHRLRLAGQVTEIRAGDLAFTPAEARALMASSGVELSDAGLARLQRQTEGWATGLRLAALSLEGHEEPERFITEFSGTERTVADYLFAEVLAGRPSAVRELLLKTSILERVNGELARELAGFPGGERALQQLENDGALVSSVDRAGSWFRYHPLLRDVLRMQLRRDAAETIPQLHRTATDWLERHGEPVQAIRHAQHAGEWPYAAELLTQHWSSLLLDGRQATLHELLAALPRGLAETDAELALVAAGDRLAGGCGAEADAFLALSDELADDLPQARRPRFVAVRAMVRLTRAHIRGDLESAIGDARAILAPPGARQRGLRVLEGDLRALALMSLGRVELWTLRLDEAERHLQEGVALARLLRRDYILIGCLGASAQAANLAERPQEAADRGQEAIHLAERRGWADDPVVGLAYLARGGGSFAGGWIGEAEHWFERAARVMRTQPDPDATVLLPICLGALRLAQGRHYEAHASLRAAARESQRLRVPHFLSPAAAAWELRARVRLGDAAGVRRTLAAADDATRGRVEWRNLAAELHLAESDPRAALDALAPCHDGPGAVTVSFDIESAVFEAVAHDALGDAAAARRAMEHALDMAEPRGRAWTFLVVPGAARLLARHLGERTAHEAFAAELLHRFTAPAASGSARSEPLREPLSRRELAVLRLLTTNLSAAEIAAELSISVHTVKTHMRHLYVKLDVHRRGDAVNRGRAVGLLSPP